MTTDLMIRMLLGPWAAAALMAILCNHIFEILRNELYDCLVLFDCPKPLTQSDTYIGLAEQLAYLSIPSHI